MFATKVLTFLLAFFVSLLNARPLHSHHRRTGCKHKPSLVSLTSVGSTATASVSASTSTQSPINNIVKGPSSSSKAPSSASHTASSALASVTEGASSLSGTTDTLQGLLGSLFPVADFQESWTTSTSSKKSLALSDSTFRPTRVLSGLSHDYVDAPDGKKSMKAHYPKGSYNFQNTPKGGISFYAPGPSNVDLTSAKEATFGYSVFFEKGFDFVKGGKLPGFYGGNTDDGSIGCSGGSRSTECFSARLMWREDGKGEFYTYLPPFTTPGFEANKKVCDVPPLSDCNPTYGASIARGAFTFATGAWTTVSERVRLNDPGKANGEIELFVGGKSVIHVDGLILRDSSAGKIRGIQMQTFFGGSSPGFATPKDQDVYFSDFSVAITETL